MSPRRGQFLQLERAELSLLKFCRAKQESCKKTMLNRCVTDRREGTCGKRISQITRPQRGRIYYQN